MRFLKLTLAYDGSQFVGWQVQKTGESIQSALENAWTKVTGEQTRVTASGRTDAGVHALAQVCSLVTTSVLKNDVLVRALNSNTPDQITILSIVDAPTNFHAIRDATEKTYRYVIQNDAYPNVFTRHYSWFIPRQLDVHAMADAAELLLGRHDFASFQAAGSDRLTTDRHVTRLTVESDIRDGYHFIEIVISADGFLYNMVRNIVGTLVEVGLGRQTFDWVAKVLGGKDRSLAGATAPPRGLFLVHVGYDRSPESLEPKP